MTNKLLDSINHFLISHGTHYWADEIKEDGTVAIYGPEIRCERTRTAGIYIAEHLLEELEKCGGTSDVEHVINTCWTTH